MIGDDVAVVTGLRSLATRSSTSAPLKGLIMRFARPGRRPGGFRPVRSMGQGGLRRVALQQRQHLERSHFDDGGVEHQGGRPHVAQDVQSPGAGSRRKRMNEWGLQ